MCSVRTVILIMHSRREKLESEERYESWENMIRKDSTSFLQVVVQKYLQNKISYEKVQEVFAILKDVIEEGDRFIAMCVDLDLTYKITDALNYEAARLELIQSLEEMFSERYFFWHFEKAEGCHVFLIKTKENATVREIAQILEQVKREQKSPVTASISKPESAEVTKRRRDFSSQSAAMPQMRILFPYL